MLTFELNYQNEENNLKLKYSQDWNKQLLCIKNQHNIINSRNVMAC